MITILGKIILEQNYCQSCNKSDIVLGKLLLNFICLFSRFRMGSMQMGNAMYQAVVYCNALDSFWNRLLLICFCFECIKKNTFINLWAYSLIKTKKIYLDFMLLHARSMWIYWRYMLSSLVLVETALSSCTCTHVVVAYSSDQLECIRVLSLLLKRVAYRASVLRDVWVVNIVCGDVLAWEGKVICIGIVCRD